ncbi:MAG: hypothetical protein RJB39_564 [Candidatus Parcubacteria bacterium]|jgi:F0F1-type ATP synthase membrane subunit a
MQDKTLQHADTFFFFTTIGVVVGIIILLLVLYFCIKAVIALRKINTRVHELLDKTGDAIEKSVEDKGIVKKSLPLALPILSFFFKKKRAAKKEKTK